VTNVDSVAGQRLKEPDGTHGVKPKLGSRQAALAAVAAIAPAVARRAQESDAFHLETFADIKAAGLPSYVVPRRFGGGGAELADAAAVIRALASADASAALVLTMHYIHTTRLLRSEEVSAYTEQIARRLAATDGLLNFAASESHSGAPSRGGAPTTKVSRRDDGDLTIEGHKRYVTGSIALDYILSTAITDDVDPETGAAVVGTFIVEADAPGVQIDPTWDTFGLRGSASNDVHFSDVRLNPQAIVNTYDPNTSAERVEDFYAWWSLLLASIHLGIALAARAVALEFASKPRSDGRAGIRADQTHIRDHAVRIDLALLQAQTLVDSVLERHTSGITPGLGPAVKLLVHQHSTDAVDHAAKLLGGVSVWPHSPLSRYYRDLRVAYFNPPNEDVVIDRLADLMFGPERVSLLTRDTGVA
jgi:alkylation response protein AidB-like acyl-CoA dehydrogenase